MTNEKLIVKVARALGDGHRLNILLEIASKGSINPTEAMHLVSQSQPAVSYHLKQLRNSELVETKKIGIAISISLNREVLQEFTQYFDDILSLVTVQKA